MFVTLVIIPQNVSFNESRAEIVNLLVLVQLRAERKRSDFSMTRQPVDVLSEEPVAVALHLSNGRRLPAVDALLAVRLLLLDRRQSVVRLRVDLRRERSEVNCPLDMAAGLTFAMSMASNGFGCPRDVITGFGAMRSSGGGGSDCCAWMRAVESCRRSVGVGRWMGRGEVSDEKRNLLGTSWNAS